MLDRDGTINVERDHITSPDQVELLPHAAEGIRLLAALTLRVVVVSNQSVIGRGWIRADVLDRIHARLTELLLDEGAKVEAFFVCPHRPDEGCACRKPNTGLAEQAARRFHADLSRSFVIGDQPSDIEFGRRVGATTILVGTGYGVHRPGTMAVSPDYHADDLGHAARLVEELVRSA